MSLVTKVLGGLAIGKLIKDSTSAAMGVENSINQISRIMGSNASAFNTWAESQAKSFGMAREEAYKYGAVYSNLISTFAKDTAETTRYTEQLIKASAVVASATGRTMEDTMDRIRSGLLGNTEAIEDLGINVNVAMLQSTEAFRKFARGRSWQQLSFQEQQQIRLLAILEQANTKYGDSLAGTTATRQMMFIATLKNIRLYLGQAFLPIYNVVLPILTSLGNMLESVTSRLAAFSQALFGKSATQTTKNVEAQAKAMGDLGDETEKAGKAAKGALAGFDELNVLQKNEAGGGANAATTTTGGLTTVASEQGQAGAIDTLASGVEATASKIKDAFARVKKVVQENKDYIISALAGIATAFVSFQVISNWSKIVGAVKLAFTGLTAAMAGISAPALAVAAVIGAIVAVIIYLWRTNDEFRENVLKIWDKIKAGISYVTTTLLETLKYLWDNHLSGVVSALWGFLGKLLELVGVIFNTFILPLISYLIDELGPAWKKTFDGIVAIVKYVVPIIADVIKGIIRAAQGVIDFLIGVFTGDWKRAWEGIKDVFGGIVGSIVTIFKGALNGIIGMINKFLDFWNSIELKVPEIEIPFFGTVGGFSIGLPEIPNIPMLAKGGIISDATLL